MSLATIYKNIILSKVLGEVIESGFPDGSDRYGGSGPTPHPHAFCIKCNKNVHPDFDSQKDR